MNARHRATAVQAVRACLNGQEADGQRGGIEARQMGPKPARTSAVVRVSGVMEPRFQKLLFGIVDAAQAARIQAALAPLTYAVPQQPEMPLPLAA